MENKYFFLEESQEVKGKFMIRINPSKMRFPTGTSGSYSVLIARVMSLSYPDCLRFCRDILKADLVGKGHTYIKVYYPDTKEVHKFVELLNSRMRYIMNEIKYPFNYSYENGKIVRTSLT